MHGQQNRKPYANLPKRDVLLSAKEIISCFRRFIDPLWKTKQAELLADINTVASPQEEVEVHMSEFLGGHYIMTNIDQ